MPVVIKERVSPGTTQKLVAILGGAVKTAELLGVTRGSVYEWISKGMPDYRYEQVVVRKPTAIAKLAEP